jgi:hypothetical protein
MMDMPKNGGETIHYESVEIPPITNLGQEESVPEEALPNSGDVYHAEFAKNSETGIQSVLSHHYLQETPAAINNKLTNAAVELGQPDVIEQRQEDKITTIYLTAHKLGALIGRMTNDELTSELAMLASARMEYSMRA